MTPIGPNMMFICSSDFETGLRLLEYAEQNGLERHIDKLFYALDYYYWTDISSSITPVNDDEVLTIFEKLKEFKGNDWVANYMATEYFNSRDFHYQQTESLIREYSSTSGSNGNLIRLFCRLNDERSALRKSYSLFERINDFALPDQSIYKYGGQFQALSVSVQRMLKDVSRAESYELGAMFYVSWKRTKGQLARHLAKESFEKGLKGTEYEGFDMETIYEGLKNGEISREDLGIGVSEDDITIEGDLYIEKDEDEDADAAMMGMRIDMRQVPEKVGGIDLNPENLDIEIKGKGVVPFNMENVGIKDFENFTGFTPIIFQMTPVINIPLLLGLDQSGKQDAGSFNLSMR